MIMMRFRKALFYKILAICIGTCFLVNTTAYSEPILRSVSSFDEINKGSDKNEIEERFSVVEEKIVSDLKDGEIELPSNNSKLVTVDSEEDRKNKFKSVTFLKPAILFLLVIIPMIIFVLLFRDTSDEKKLNLSSSDSSEITVLQGHDLPHGNSILMTSERKAQLALSKEVNFLKTRLHNMEVSAVNETKIRKVRKLLIKKLYGLYSNKYIEIEDLPSAGRAIPQVRVSDTDVIKNFPEITVETLEYIAKILPTSTNLFQQQVVVGHVGLRIDNNDNAKLYRYFMSQYPDGSIIADRVRLWFHYWREDGKEVYPKANMKTQQERTMFAQSIEQLGIKVQITEVNYPRDKYINMMPGFGVPDVSEKLADHKKEGGKMVYSHKDRFIIAADDFSPTDKKALIDATRGIAKLYFVPPGFKWIPPVPGDGRDLRIISRHLDTSLNVLEDLQILIVDPVYYSKYGEVVDHIAKETGYNIVKVKEMQYMPTNFVKTRLPNGSSMVTMNYAPETYRSIQKVVGNKDISKVIKMLEFSVTGETTEGASLRCMTNEHYPLAEYLDVMGWSRDMVLAFMNAMQTSPADIKITYSDAIITERGKALLQNELRLRSVLKKQLNQLEKAKILREIARNFEALNNMPAAREADREAERLEGLSNVEFNSISIKPVTQEALQSSL